MFRLGYLKYNGEEYYMHICTNGSKMRFVLLSGYTSEQKEQIELASLEDLTDENNEIRLENLKSQKVDIQFFSKVMINNKLPYVVGALQTDKKAGKAFTLGDTSLIQRFMKDYEEVMNFSYSEDSKDETVRVIKENEKVTTVEKTFGQNSTDSFKFSDVKELGSVIPFRGSIVFSKGGLTFSTFTEENKSVHSAPYKNWEWEELIDFDMKKFRRSIISLSAKSMAQLRQEKDLSWYFNKDGTIKKDYKVLHTMDEVRQMVNEIETNRNVIITKDPKKDFPIAIDCETTGLNINSLPWTLPDGTKNPLKDEIGGMSLTWRRDQGVYIPFMHTKFQNVDRDECLTFLKPYLEKWYLETHNGLFDGKVFLSYGIKLNIREDSMIMLFHVNPGVAKGSKGLKENTLRRYGHETLDHDDVFPSKKDVTSYYDLTEDIVTCYACADSDYTYQLCADVRKEIPSMRAYALDMRVMKYLIKVNYNGNKVDEKLLNRLSSVCDEDIKVLEETMFKFVGQIGQLTQFEKVMQMQLKAGAVTKEEVDRLRDELIHDEEFKQSRNEFNIGSSDVLCDILYNKLNYPVVRVSKTSGKPTADKYALKDLAKEDVEAGQEGTWLKEDIYSSVIYKDLDAKKEENVLISAHTFNTKKYPFVLLVQKWKDLMKLKTTFFAWFLNGACDNMYYSDFSMTNAETSRIIGRIQTLKGAMKQLIVPFSDEYYLMGVDFSQIEARMMAHLAGSWDLVERLCNPRADYHVESAAMLTGKQAWEITKSERGDLKSVNFAVPYGMAEYSLAENLYGRPVTQDKIEKAGILLAKWKKANWQIQALLDSYRKFARDTHEMARFNDETRKIEKQKVRFIVNNFGRRRFFKVDDNTPKYLGSIDRMSGNYPIQSFAAERFKTAFVNINKRLEAEGLDNKVFITALVHDEFLMNVHRSVDKYKLYEILWEEMVQSIYLPKKDVNGDWMKTEDGEWDLDKEHPVKYYFAGISIGPDWHDIHGNDAHEAPNEYLMYMVDQIKSGKYKFKEYESGDVTEECFNETKAFMKQLLVKECYKWQPDLAPNNVQFYKIVPAFFDYFLKGKLKIYGEKPIRDTDGTDEDDIRARLEPLLMWALNSDTLMCYDTEDTKTPRMIIKGSVLQDKKSEEEIPEISTDIDIDDLDLTFSLDEDLTNFDDDIDDNDDFGISIPVGVYKQEKKDFDIIARRTNPEDERDIWDLVDFHKQINTYDATTENRYYIRSDTIYINIEGEDIDKVSELCKYIASKSNPDGRLSVKLQLRTRIKDTNIKVDELNRDDIYKIMNWSIFAV